MSDNSEYYTILNTLQECHALFAEFWSIGRFETVTDHTDVDTAEIRFDRDGSGVCIRVNDLFWKSLSSYEKSFVLAHEFYHSYLKHGSRLKNLGNDKKANIAGDIVINHGLIEGFGFDRSLLRFHFLDNFYAKDGTEIKGVDTLCWIDTVFPKRNDVEYHRSTEYYFGLLPDDPSSMNLLGGHSYEEDELDPDAAEKFIKQLTDRLSDKEIKDFNDRLKNSNSDEYTNATHAGSLAGQVTKLIQISNIVKKKKWEEVVRDILGRSLGKKRLVKENSWTRKNRRITAMSKKLRIPAEVKRSIPIRERVDLWVFLDTSGSCERWARRFVKVAASIPEDRFNVRCFCFDTAVYEVSLKTGELRGFGGTAFNIIESYIQKMITNGDGRVLYPEAVFIVTDGAGNNVYPERPHLWHWFLTPSSTTRFIPETSSTYDLTKYE